MLEWKEHEHEENDLMAVGNLDTMEALNNCWLLKFFLCPNMRAQSLLLAQLVNMWDPNSQHFVVRDEILMVEIEDIYFLMGLSH